MKKESTCEIFLGWAVIWNTYILVKKKNILHHSNNDDYTNYSPKGKSQRHFFPQERICESCIPLKYYLPSSKINCSSSTFLLLISDAKMSKAGVRICYLQAISAGFCQRRSSVCALCDDFHLNKRNFRCRNLKHRLKIESCLFQ